MTLYLVRIGQQAHCMTLDGGEKTYCRGEQVIGRTTHGLEVGEVLQAVPTVEASRPPEGTIERSLTAVDIEFWRYLCDLSMTALQLCASHIEKVSAADLLLDCEPMFDGRTLKFHFLGEVTEETRIFTDELVHRFRAAVLHSPYAHCVEVQCNGCTGCGRSGCGSQSGCSKSSKTSCGSCTGCGR